MADPSDPHKRPAARRGWAAAFHAGLPSGVGVGIAVGVAIGVALNQIAIGISLGVAIGLALSPVFGAGRLNQTRKDEADAASSEETVE